MTHKIQRIKIFLIVLIFLSCSLFLAAQNKGDKSKEKDPVAKLSLSALKFRAIGPALTSGRISDFAVNPDNISEFYVATSSGGVWKTTNAGTTFKPIFDKEGSYSIGCITMDPNNTNVLWVGTGENNNQRSVAYGDGVYKSEDGGKSWKNMGLKESEHIGTIAVDPRNSDVVYVAAYGPLWNAGGDRGLYKTIDGGKNWEAVLTLDEHTGVSEIHLDPKDPNVIYVVAHQRRRRVWTYLGGGPESAIYKSKDAGASFSKINKGLPKGDLGRIGLAISPMDSNTIYAIVEAQEGKGGFYRSANAGASWEKQSNYTSRGNYYQEIFCDPKEIDRVYSMDVYLKVTDDGGKTFRNLGERSKHVDNHAMWIDPDNTDYYLVGCDGGIYESFDRGNTWKYMPNLPVTQFYKVAIDYAEPFYFVYGGTQDNYSLGGPSRTNSAHGIVNSDWYTTQGGDGFESQVDPKDPNIVYAQSQHGNLVRFDKKSGEKMGIKPRERKGEKSYRWNWDAPLLISPHSNTRLYFAANKVFRSDDRGNTWKVISDDLSRQIDRNTLPIMGRVWPMDAVAKNASTSQYGNIVALDESPLQEDLLFVGTDDGLIHVTEDSGQTWRKIDKFPGIPAMTYVNEVLASQHDRNTVYAAFNNHKSGDFKPYILKSTDLGNTWASIASNLPERGSVYALAEDQKNGDLLFAGTEFGLFFTVDGGKSWKQLKEGLPVIAIRDIAIQKRENDLVLGSFGRGFYVLDDYTPLRELKSVVDQKEAHIFPVKTALMFVQSAPLGSLGTQSKAFQGENYFTAPNPPVGATFTYYLKEDIKTLKDKRIEKEKALIKDKKPVPYPTYERLQDEEEEKTPYLIFTILDEEGSVIRRLRANANPGPLTKTPGLYRMFWDLKYPGVNPISSSDISPTKSSPSSTFVLPGTYKVFLSKSQNGEITKLTDPVNFEVVTLANVSLPAEDRAELVAFQKKVRELSRAVTASSRILGEVSEKIDQYRAALKSVTAPDSDLPSDIDVLEKKVKALGIKFNGDRTMRRADKDAVPGISARIRSIAYEQSRSTSAPTQTQRDAYEIAAEEFAPVLEELKKIVEVDVKKIEEKLEGLGAPYTPGRLPEWKKQKNVGR
jgi:photosystem II stability/assembly factor-like uncharacterized protein